MSETTDIARRTPQQELIAQVRSDLFQQQIGFALPENVPTHRFVRAAITALQANPKLAELDRDSVFRALIECAQTGLMPDGKEAAIVPFKGKAVLIAMVFGYRKIAADHGWTIRTAVVYANDEFEYELGAETRLRHVPPRPGVNRGEKIAAYAVAAHVDGRREIELMDAAEIAKIRATSRGANDPDSPWNTWEERMWEKSPARRLFKKLPIGALDARVLRIREADNRPYVEQATLMYGPQASAGELPAAKDTSGAEMAAPQAGVRQQAEEATAPPFPEASSAPDPDDDDEPPLPAAAQQGRAEEAGLVTVPAIEGKRIARAGKTLADIRAEGKEGVAWFAWALEDVRPWNRPDSEEHAVFRQALREYVAAHLPELAEGATNYRALEREFLKEIP